MSICSYTNIVESKKQDVKQDINNSVSTSVTVKAAKYT